MMGEFTENNVGMIEDRLMPLPLSTSDDNPTPEMVGAERWGVAEKETQRIVSQFRATFVSEERRKEVIDYVQRLLRGCLGCEVFPYGSVPLKTYLPDGDIDLTAFGGASGEDTLADHIVSVLEAEEGNKNAEFVVKDVQLIRAEVKLVKCIVQNIVVDISLNQIGGLCTLCFLEQVDRVIGKDHLFKRSIILIKAWCYYESRVLGAHHGLISTYALETLVLYIFHFFHPTLDGPLAVLYKFLDYFSKFDWETYCISLNGPVRISALPDLLAEMPQNGTHDLLLGNDFLRFCSEMFSVPFRGVEMNSRAFPPKYMNIVDPLKDNNNLGRSVNKGNFYRIRSAFTFGAQKLSRILTSPVDDIGHELQMFFSSSLDRHGSGQRPDVEGSPPSGYARLEPENCIGTARDNSKQNHSGSGSDIEDDRMQNGEVRSFIGFPMLADYENIDEHMILLGHRVTGDAKDLATSKLEGLKISNERTNQKSLANEKTNDGDVNQSEKFEKDEVVVASGGIPESNGSNLSGDYKNHFMSLQHGRWLYEYFSSAMPPPPPPPFPASFEVINYWDPLGHPFQQLRRNGFSHGNVNDVNSPMFYTAIPMLAPPVVFGPEEMPKHRGTGTYFPNPNRPPNGVRPLIPKGRNLRQAARLPRINNRFFAYVEPNMHDRNNLEEQISQSRFVPQPRQMLNHPNANGYVLRPETIVVESDLVKGPVSSRQSKSPALLRPQMTGQGFPAPTTQRPRPVPGPDRLMVKKTYHLKDEDDFPPLPF